jgi:hypothetical protein
MHRDNKHNIEQAITWNISKKDKNTKITAIGLIISVTIAWKIEENVKVDKITSRKIGEID